MAEAPAGGARVGSESGGGALGRVTSVCMRGGRLVPGRRSSAPHPCHCCQVAASTVRCLFVDGRCCVVGCSRERSSVWVQRFMHVCVHLCTHARTCLCCVSRVITACACILMLVGALPALLCQRTERSVFSGSVSQALLRLNVAKKCCDIWKSVL